MSFGRFGFIARIWAGLRPWFIFPSLLLLAFSLIVGVRSWVKTDQWYAHLIHPDHDFGWGRQYEIETSRGYIAISVNTEVCDNASIPFLDHELPIDCPTFLHNPPSQSNPGGCVFIPYDREGNTLLLAAVRAGSEDQAFMLIAWGAEVKAAVTGNSGATGRTALHLLAGNRMEKQRQLMSLLLEKGANINARDIGGGTPLHAAVAAGDQALAQYLVEAGADLSARDNDGKRPVDYLGSGDPSFHLLLTPNSSQQTQPAEQ